MFSRDSVRLGLREAWRMQVDHTSGSAVPQQGVPLAGASDHGVSEAIYLQDPDGNGIELYRDRDQSEWPRDSDGRVAMVTLPLDMAGLLAEAR